MQICSNQNTHLKQTEWSNQKTGQQDHLQEIKQTIPEQKFQTDAIGLIHSLNNSAFLA